MRIEIKGISFAYDSIKVLKDFTFQMERPEIVSLIGPNGSGKTTLLRCLNRKLLPQQGCVLVTNQDLISLSRKEIARQIGVVPQMSHISFPFTVTEIVLMGRTPYLGRFEALSKKDFVLAQEMLQLVDIEPLADRPITEVSGGEYQRVIIARALVQEPAILLLDEPTLHLDLNHQLELLELLKNLVSKKGLGVIMASHDINLALRYSNRLILLNSGIIYAQGNPEEVLTRENLREVYKIEAQILRPGTMDSINIIPVSSLPRRNESRKGGNQ